MRANGITRRRERRVQEERKKKDEGRSGRGRLYNWSPKRDDRPRTEKEAQVGQARLAEISCADLVWKIRIVTPFISSSFGQSLGCLYEQSFHQSPSPSRSLISVRTSHTLTLITSKPTSYFLIQFPLSSALLNLIVMKLSSPMMPRIAHATVSPLLRPRYRKTYVSNDKSHFVLGLDSWHTVSVPL